MKNWYGGATIIALILVFAMVGCKDEPTEEPANLTLNFKAFWDEAPLILGEYYPLPDGNQININILEFYISDITLLNGAQETPIAEIEYVNFRKNHLTAAGAALGESIALKGVPEGTYTGIRFGIGVPPALNSQDPSAFPSTNALSNSGNFWTWNEGYIFTKLEGSVDTVGNSGVLDIYLTYHTGDDERYRTKTIIRNFEIKGGESLEIPLVFDLKMLLFHPNNTFNLLKNNQTHTAGDEIWIADEIMNAYPDAIQ